MAWGRGQGFSPHTISIYPTSPIEKNTLPHYSAEELEDNLNKYMHDLEEGNYHRVVEDIC